MAALVGAVVFFLILLFGYNPRTGSGISRTPNADHDHASGRETRPELADDGEPEAHEPAAAIDAAATRGSRGR